MAIREKRKAKPLMEDSDEEEEEGGLIVAAAAAAAAGESGVSNALTNVDLRLQVSERATRRCGGLAAGNLASSSSSVEVKGTRKKKRKKWKKKLKVRKEDAGEQSLVRALIRRDNAAINTAKAANEDSDNLELRKLLRRPRYFDPQSIGWATCYNCGEEGHMAVNCTAKKKRKPCFVCGSLDHHGMRCAKGLECFICQKAGHCARDCSDKQGSLSEDLKLCLKCGESGHDMFSCGNDYDPDDLKKIQCYICKTHGHLCCVNSANINKTVISCFRCGEWGHEGLVCTRQLENDANAGVQSAHLSLFKNKSAHSARPRALKRRAAKAKKKLAELKASSVQPFKSENKASPKTALEAVVKTRKRKKNRMDEGTNSMPQKSMGGCNTEDPGDTSPRKSKKNSSPKTALPAVVKTSERKKSRMDEGTNSTPQKSRAGWNTEDLGDSSRSKMKKYNWNSPSSREPYEYNLGAPSFQGSEAGFEQQYFASRFGDSDGTHDSPGKILRIPGSYGHPARTYGHSGSTYGHRSMYDQFGGTYGHRNAYNQSSNTYGHRNTYDHAARTYGHSGSPYGYRSMYDQFGSTYGHRNAYNQSSNTYGHRNTYDQSGGMFGYHGTYGHYNTYGPSSSMYGNHNTYDHSGGMHGHHNTYGHLGSMYADHDRLGRSGDAYGYPSSSYDPAQAYGNVHGYSSSSYDPTRGDSAGRYDNDRALFGNDISWTRWNHGR